MSENKVLPTKLENVGSVEFGCGQIVFFTECDSYNRPCIVNRLDLETGKQTSLFVDDDPTHYLDIGMTKDKKYLVINSNTKEDSEIWVVARDNAANEVVPRKLIPRVKGITSHIDHLRDFFVTITTSGSKQKAYKIAMLNDSVVADSSEQEEAKASGYEWQDLLPL